MLERRKENKSVTGTVPGSLFIAWHDNPTNIRKFLYSHFLAYRHPGSKNTVVTPYPPSLENKGGIEGHASITVTYSLPGLPGVTEIMIGAYFKGE